MSTLVDELTQKQVNSFQLNMLNHEFISKTLLNNTEGIFNLSPGINDRIVDIIKKYLKNSHNDYEFESNYNLDNYEIMFKKKELKN